MHQAPLSPEKFRDGNWLVTGSRPALPGAGHSAGRVDTSSASVCAVPCLPAEPWQGWRWCAHRLPGRAVRD